MCNCGRKNCSCGSNSNLPNTVRDLGWANSWKETPKEVVDCRHKVIKTEIGRCQTQHYCPTCNHVYKIDCSD